MARTSYFQWNDDDDVRFVLDQQAELDFYSASSLKQQSVDRHVAPLGHIILIASQTVLLFLLNATCLCEMQQIPV
jgi:predicted alpha/beta hydrolase